MRVQTRAFVDWRRSWFGYCLAFAFLLPAIYFFHWVHPVGYSISFLAVAAAVMTLRPDMKGMEKVVWVLVIFVFLRAELKAIAKDRTDADNHFQAMISRFDQLQLTQNSLLVTFQNLPRPVERPATRPPNVPKQDLRTRGLVLSKDILEFLADRQRTAPAMTIPHVLTSSPALASQTPPYMKETLAQFAQRFQPRIANIRDELLSVGLKDGSLDLAANDPTGMYGDTHTFIRNVGDAIRNLVLELPSEDLYHDVSDADLARMSFDEADKIEKMGNDAINKLGTSESPDSIRFRFQSSFHECCLDQVKNLRGAMLRRLGPAAVDMEEMRTFQEFVATETFPGRPSASISVALWYMPQFRNLAKQLQEKALASQKGR